ncbi:MAG: phosphoribosyltransferase [Propionibacteriales bacterium]|nr:phosphoribosyltransferase [Propionibacteriales bacterium]
MFGKPPYEDRSQAGRELASHLERLGLEPNPLVLGLPRGGVVVAAEVARVLGGELDVLCVRKLGAPGHRELAIGAIASGGTRVVDDELAVTYGLDDVALDALTERELAELHRRERAYRDDRPPLKLAGRQVVLVDDGVATGATARSACLAVRKAGVTALVLAAPVAPTEVVGRLSEVADRAVFPITSRHFGWVGRWYADFGEVTDEEVQVLLAARPT